MLKKKTAPDVIYLSAQNMDFHKNKYIEIQNTGKKTAVEKNTWFTAASSG